MTINKIVGDKITFDGVPTGGAPSGTNYNIVYYKILSTGIRKDLISFANVPLSNHENYDYIFVTEDVGTINLNGDFSYTCPSDSSIKKITLENQVNVSATVPLSVQLSINPSTITIGQSVTFTAIPSGGSGPYSYIWHNLPTPCSDNSSSITCTPTNSGTYSVYVVVTDSTGSTTNSNTITLTVNPQAHGITVLHHSSNVPTSSPGKCTIPSTHAHSLIFVGIAGSFSNVTVEGVSDNVNNTYVQVANARASYKTGWTEVWYAKNSVAGTTSVTVSLSSSEAFEIWIFEVSGIDLLNPLQDVGLTNNGIATTTPEGGSVTIANANDFIGSIISVAHSITGIHSGNSFSLGDITTATDASAYKITMATGTYRPQWDQNLSGTFCSSTVAFKGS